MSTGGPIDERERLLQAQHTIAQQREEIAALRQQLADEAFAAELRRALTLAATAGAVAAPVTHSRLLEMIVATAAQVINAHAASLFLIDEQAQELVFEVALGQKAEEVRKFRVPLGHGIAGLVAVTGQAMAISDAQVDPRHAADIAQSVGYVPRSILCVPLFYNDQIVGVLELLDKTDAPSFSAADMELLGLFANLAAVAIEQSRTHHDLGALIGQVLSSFSAAPNQDLRQQAQQFAGHMEAEDAVYRRALGLAELVQEIAWQGDHEVQACRAILEAFASFLRSRPSVGRGLEDLR
jgi:GAF domain-containing protein